jgi:hypothetical protein
MCFRVQSSGGAFLNTGSECLGSGNFFDRCDFCLVKTDCASWSPGDYVCVSKDVIESVSNMFG